MRLITKTTRNKEIIDLTDQIDEILSKQKESSGVCNIHLAHTTAAITTADLDPGTDLDLLDAIEKIIPKLNFRHPHDSTHTPDHIASALIGTSVSIPFENKKLILGDWQRVVLIEFNGPRERQVIVTIS